MTLSPGRLTVHRHAARYRLTGAAPAVTRSTLDRALGQELSTALDAALAAAALPEGCWLVRRLDARICVAPGWSPGRVAAELAREVARALTTALGADADRGDVLWFPDRAALLGRYLTDLCAHRAAGRWEYAQFAACSGPSAAVLALADTEPAELLRALTGLPEEDRHAVLSRLEPGAAATVLRRLAATDPPGPDPAGEVVAALTRLLAGSRLPRTGRAAALALYVEAAARGLRPTALLAARARELAGLVTLLRARPAAAALAVARGDWSALGAAGAAAAAALAGWPSEPRRAAARALLADASGGPVGTPPSGTVHTPLGGMFLLLPLLEELPWEAATRTWPGLDGVPAGHLARFLALIAALGRHRAATAAQDGVLRLALGIPPTVDAAAVSAWSARVSAADAAAFRRACVAAHRADGRVNGSVAVSAAGERVLAVDAARGLWLAAAPAAPRAVRALADTVGADLAGAPAVSGTEPWIAACLPAARQAPVDPHPPRRLADQLAYATVGRPFALSPPLGEAVTLAGQALLRDLAWRLPGFSRSTLPYLSANVLSCEASVDLGEEIVVHLGAPPLHVVVALAGLDRRRFRLPATGERTWTLTPRR